MRWLVLLAYSMKTVVSNGLSMWSLHVRPVQKHDEKTGKEDGWDSGVFAQLCQAIQAF